MSKRDAETSVLKYREMGYLPEAIVNYLARLGWGHGDQEIFSASELQALFSLEHVNLSPSRFDINKLLHLNAHYIKTADPSRLAVLLVPFLKARGIDASPSAWLAGAVKTLQERARTLAEMADSAEYYFREKEVDPKAAAKFLTPEIAPAFEELAEAFAALPEFVPAATEKALQAVVERRGGNLKIHQPVRVALTGGTASPGLFDVMEILGREETVRRLSAAAKRIRSV
jgi:glutamyl-tRNA synthetase